MINKSNGVEETLGDCDTGFNIQLETDELLEKHVDSKIENDVESDKFDISEKGGADKSTNGDNNNIAKNNHAGSFNNRVHSAPLTHLLSSSDSTKHAANSVATYTPTVATHTTTVATHTAHTTTVATPTTHTTTVATPTTHTTTVATNTATVATPVTLLSPSRTSTRSLRGSSLSVCETEEASQISIPSVTKSRGKILLRSTYLTSLPPSPLTTKKCFFLSS